MGGVVERLTGGGERRRAQAMADAAAARQEAALADQARQLADERSRLEAAERGQARLRNGGGRNMLAYADEKLGKKLGGGRAA